MNLHVHHQEHCLIYYITQFGTLVQASLVASSYYSQELCISLVIYTLQYGARYTQRQMYFENCLIHIYTFIDATNFPPLT